MKLNRHVSSPELKLIKTLLDNSKLNSFRNRRPFTRPALDSEHRELQLVISRKKARVIPHIKEKRLINGKWTRDYSTDIS